MKAPKELLRYTCAETKILAIKSGDELDNLLVHVVEAEAGLVGTFVFACRPVISGQDIGLRCQARYVGKKPQLSDKAENFTVAGIAYYRAAAVLEPGSAIIEEMYIGQNKVSCSIYVCRHPTSPDL